MYEVLRVSFFERAVDCGRYLTVSRSIDPECPLAVCSDFSRRFLVLGVSEYRLNPIHNTRGDLRLFCIHSLCSLNRMHET